MAPLTSLINKKKGTVQWNPEAIDLFGKIKEICAKDALLFYLNFGENLIYILMPENIKCAASSATKGK